MFAGVAPHYDLLNHLLSLNIDKRWRRRAIRTAPPKPGGAVLDVCTGTGDLAFGYEKAGAGRVRVIGADFCHEMLVIARAKNRKQGQSVEFIEADATRLPFPDDSFDIVSVAFGLRNISDHRAGLAEMTRVTRPGGRIVVLEFSRPRIIGLRWLYLAYFRHVLPRVGQILSRSSHQAYHYLPASVLAFPDGEEMLALLEESGLQQAQAHRLTFGIATLYVAQKPLS
jgi:demethylmenaquinone methyltransferase/2-methoxy-6-polyprenyl-1,4-benzoquinol methylase